MFLVGPAGDEDPFVGGAALVGGSLFLVLVEVVGSGGALDVGAADVVLVRDVVLARGAADELERYVIRGALAEDSWTPGTVLFFVGLVVPAGPAEPAGTSTGGGRHHRLDGVRTARRPAAATEHRRGSDERGHAEAREDLGEVRLAPVPAFGLAVGHRTVGRAARRAGGRAGLADRPRHRRRRRPQQPRGARPAARRTGPVDGPTAAPPGPPAQAWQPARRTVPGTARGCSPAGPTG